MHFNYPTLDQLNAILYNLERDTMQLGFTIATLMIVVYTIMVMFDFNLGAKMRTDRWEEIRKVFLCAAIIAAAGTIIGFSQVLGGTIPPPTTPSH